MTARFRVPSWTNPFFLYLPSVNLKTYSYTDSQIVNELVSIIIPSGIERINKVNAVIYTSHYTNVWSDMNLYTYCW